jgi:hypothetical protein
MSAQILGLVLIPLALPLAASAASRIKRAPAKEVYAATDASEMQPGVAAGFAMPVESDVSGATLPTAPATLPAATQAAPAAKAHKAAKPQAAAPATPVAASVPKAASSAPTFDAVPASQSEAILQRLKIVENLVRKYGRAYDYRTHTLKELELIQSTLETSAAQAKTDAQVEAQVSARMQRAAIAAPAPAPAAQAATSDTIRTGQAAAVEENAEETNLGALPPPADYDPNQSDADQEN